MRDLKEYFRPASPEEAYSIKARYGEAAVYLAGGSDLLVNRPGQVRAAIDIRHAGLNEIEEQADAYVIGGAARLRDVESRAGHLAAGMLGAAVRDTAPWLIRNAATLTGNLVNASPAADSIPALIALDAQVVLLGDREEALPAAEVPVGPHHTSLGDRLVVAIRIPRAATERDGRFVKHSRSKSDIAQVNMAVTLRRDGDVVRDVRIVLGAVGPTALRARTAESLVEGNVLEPDMLAQVEAAVREDVRPISDWRASAEYRRRVAGVLVRRALAELIFQPRKEVA